MEFMNVGMWGEGGIMTSLTEIKKKKYFKFKLIVSDSVLSTDVF